MDIIAFLLKQFLNDIANFIAFDIESRKRVRFHRKFHTRVKGVVAPRRDTSQVSTAWSNYWLGVHSVVRTIRQGQKGIQG